MHDYIINLILHKVSVINRTNLANKNSIKVYRRLNRCYAINYWNLTSFLTVYVSL